MQLRLPATTTKYDYFRLSGGLDLLTPPLQLPPGYVRDALNFEQSVTGGYTRIAGYERMDGRPAPSAAVYAVLTVDLHLHGDVYGAIAIGDTITGVTSGATGQVISMTAAGAITADPLASYWFLAYTKATGTFVVTEGLNVAATLRGSITALGGADAAEDWDATQTNLAADVYRADIAAVPGSGAIRGGVYFNGVNYAWRDNAGATIMEIYKSTAGGWVKVTLLNEVSFTAGSVSPTIGAAITQGANSATVRAITLESGSWAGGTAAGRFIVTTPAPGNFAAGALTAGGTANLTAIQTAITIPPGGHVQTDIGNFDGTPRVYGCDGVGRGFEFDGTYYVPITTGRSPDTPSNVLVHKDHLFWGFGPILKHSGITTPYTYTALSGGAEYRCDSNITALLRQPGQQSTGAMSISTQTSTDMFYGTSAANFAKVPFEQSAGARSYGAQTLGGQSVIFGDIGVSSISATQNFGNFVPSSLSMKIRPFTQVRRSLCTGSLVNREKSQYRVFFSDQYGLYMTIVNGRLMGALPVYFANKVSACWRGASPDGTEVSYFGSDNGMVYTLDAGTSHDGADITGLLQFAFNAQGNPNVLKDYRTAQFELQGDGYAAFNVSWEVGYGTPEREQGVVGVPLSAVLSNVRWDQLDAYFWDATGVVWDGRALVPTEIRLAGVGENIGVTIVSISDKYRPYTINSAIIRYINRRALK